MAAPAVKMVISGNLGGENKGRFFKKCSTQRNKNRTEWLTGDDEFHADVEVDRKSRPVHGPVPTHQTCGTGPYQTVFACPYGLALVRLLPLNPVAVDNVADLISVIG